MPWFPDFVAAAELARRETRAAGQSDPVAHHVTALTRGDANALEATAQAGLAVFERDAGGLLAAVRYYDDVEAPVGR
jgi:hypothetical protein